MENAIQRRIRNYRLTAWTIGVVAALALVVGGVFRHKQFFVSYLWAYFYWFGFWVGSAIMVMIHYLTGGKWGHPIKRIIEAVMDTLPILTLLFVPILVGCSLLYPIRAALFATRSIVFFAIWLFFALRLRRLRYEQNRNRDIHAARHAIALSGAGVVVLPLVATFAYADWLMSLEPQWRSTVFPLVLLAGQVLSTFAFSILLLRWFTGEPASVEAATEEANHQLGNLLLTFVLFWAYVAFGELLIIYSANEPEEIAWYLLRIAGGWNALLILVALFHFFIPFLLLLFRGFKRSGKCLAWLSAGLLTIHVVYTFWVVVPSITRNGFRIDWMDPVGLLAIGGIWLGSFFGRLKVGVMTPVYDVRRKEELEYADA